MSDANIAAAAMPVIAALERLGVEYYICGSVASSIHGLPRSTLDVDMVAALDRSHVDSLVAALRNDYYIDAGMIRRAIERRASFNVIHLATMLKIDVFVAKQTPYDLQALRRAGHGVLDDGENPVKLASAEDTALAKLVWFRAGGEASERQWHDILGIFRVHGARLDIEYMRRWGSDLGVAYLLAKCLEEAGLADR